MTTKDDSDAVTVLGGVDNVWELKVGEDFEEVACDVCGHYGFIRWECQENRTSESRPVVEI